MCSNTEMKICAVLQTEILKTKLDEDMTDNWAYDANRGMILMDGD